MSRWSYQHWMSHAEALARVRACCSSNAQLEIVDRVGRELMTMYEDDAPRAFDPDWFARCARLGQHYTINTLQQRKR